MEKPPRTFWQIWNMSFGFLGIQFGWGLQMANMSAIYEYLGARADQIPILWLAAPLTGLIVQPIIGHASDRTWGRLGRRRPYFLAGAILSSMALILMPRSSALQSLFIGLGAVISSALPYLLTNVFHMAGTRAAGTIPLTVRLSFYIGAAAFLSAVLWTVFTTKEYSPDNLAEFQKEKHAHRGVGAGVGEILASVRQMPRTMRQLAWVQICTWLALFCMWLYFPVAVARNVFGAADTNSPLYSAGVEWAGICFGMYSLVCFGFSFLLPVLARQYGRKATHSFCLICGGLGLLSVAMIHNKYLLLFSMVGVGVAWASTLSMPYSILAGSFPVGKTGVYMGIFNFFIVIPEITASLGFGWIMGHLLNNNRIAAVVTGGVFFILAAMLTQRVEDLYDIRQRSGSLAGSPVAAKS